MNLYFSVGLPNGYTELSNGITFSPKLVSLSANEGSAGGSVITAIVKGAGVSDNITLYSAHLGGNICQIARMTAYGELECHMKA
jgi:hypothetical protein